MRTILPLIVAMMIAGSGTGTGAHAQPRQIRHDRDRPDRRRARPADRAAAVARTRLGGLRRGRGGPCQGRLPRAAAAAARHAREQGTAEGHHAARSRARRRDRDRARERRARRDRRPRLWQLGRAHDRGGSPQAGARRRARRGGGEEISAAALPACLEERRHGRCPRRSGSPPCRRFSSPPATIRKSG